MSTQPTSSQGSPGTATGFLNSLQGNKINLPVVGSVSVLTVGIGALLTYFLLFRGRKSGGVKVYA